jgi:hypothetical protein
VQNTAQRARNAPRSSWRRNSLSSRQPLWLRAAALFCVLLVSVAGIAQAAHVHGDLLPNRAPHLDAQTTNTGATSEDACPLCVAMHSALPAVGFAAPPPALLLETRLILASSRKPRTEWNFAAFSRPPPIAVA